MSLVEEEADHSSEVDFDAGSDEEDETASDISESPAGEGEDGGAGTSPTKSKKKKKKKKKKPVISGAVDPDVGSPTSKHENDQRFNAALKSLLEDDKDLLWMRLDSCNLHESKTRKLAKVLEKNKHLTSLDLSGNHINNQAVLALAAALESGAAPELISLDLRDNPIGLTGEDALESLQGVRRALKIDLKTPREGPEREAEAVSGPEDGGADWALNQDSDGPMSKISQTLAHHAIAPFFQGQGRGGSASQENIPSDPAVVAASLWSEVWYGYGETRPNIPRMGAALHAIAMCCDEELVVCGQAPVVLRGVGHHGPFQHLRPHSCAAVKRLNLCRDILGVESPEIVTPFSRGWQQPTVGTHRMAVAEVVARLLSIGDSAVDVAVADLDLVTHLVRLSLDRPHCSPLQTMCLRLLRLALDSHHHSLWSPLLQPNLGLTAEDSSPLESRPSLQRYLALVGEAARDTPPGRHSPDVGFAITCAHMLRTRYDYIASVRLSGEPSLECSTSGPFRTGPSADSEASQHDESAQHKQPAQLSTVQQEELGQQDRSLPGDSGLPNGDWDHIDEAQLSQPASKANSIRLPSTIMENGVLSEASERLLELLEGDEAWQDFSAPQGTLDHFLSMAEGELCGPRPVRGMFGHSMMTGQVLPASHMLTEDELHLQEAPGGNGDSESEPTVTLTNGQLRAMLEDLTIPNK